MLGVGVVGIVARLAAAATLGDTFHFIDEAIYLDAAHRLVAGAGYGEAYTNVPGYPLVLAVLAAPWPTSVVLVRCAQAVLAGAAVLLLVALGKRTVGAGPALVAAAIYALDPLLVFAGGLLYAEAVGAALLMAALLAAWSAARTDRLGLSAAAGLALAALVACRPVAFVLLPVVAAWVAWTVAGRRTAHALVIAACCVLALAPWAVRNVRLHGHVVPAGTAGLKGAPVPTTAIASDGLAGAMAARAWRDPIALAAHVVSEFGHFWELYPTRLATDNPVSRAALHRTDPRMPETPTFATSVRDGVSALSFGAELALAIVGVALAWRRDRHATVLLVGVALAYALGFSLFVSKLRYRIVVLPCLLLFAGVGVTALAAALRRDGARSTARETAALTGSGEPL